MLKVSTERSYKWQHMMDESTTQVTEVGTFCFVPSMILVFYLNLMPKMWSDAISLSIMMKITWMLHVHIMEKNLMEFWISRTPLTVESMGFPWSRASIVSWKLGIIQHIEKLYVHIHIPAIYVYTVQTEKHFHRRKLIAYEYTQKNNES